MRRTLRSLRAERAAAAAARLAARAKMTAAARAAGRVWAPAPVRATMRRAPTRGGRAAAVGGGRGGTGTDAVGGGGGGARGGGALQLALDVGRLAEDVDPAEAEGPALLLGVRRHLDPQPEPLLLRRRRDEPRARRAAGDRKLLRALRRARRPRPVERAHAAAADYRGGGAHERVRTALLADEQHAHLRRALVGDVERVQPARRRERERDVGRRRRLREPAAASALGEVLGLVLRRLRGEVRRLELDFRGDAHVGERREGGRHSDDISVARRRGCSCGCAHGT